MMTELTGAERRVADALAGHALPGTVWEKGSVWMTCRVSSISSPAAMCQKVSAS